MSPLRKQLLEAPSADRATDQACEIRPDPLRDPLALGLLEIVVEEAASEIYVFDPDTRALVLANERARSNLGYRQSEIPRMSMDDMLDAGSVGRLKTTIEELGVVHAGHAIFRGRHKRRDGSVYEVEASTKIAFYNDRLVVIHVATDQSAMQRAGLRVQRLADLERLCVEAMSPVDIPRQGLEWLLGDGRWTLGCFVPAGGFDAVSDQVWLGEDLLNWRRPDRAALVALAQEETRDSAACRWLHDRELAGSQGLPSVLLMPLRVEGETIGVFCLVAGGSVEDCDLLIGCEEAQAHLCSVHERKATEDALAEARGRLEVAVDSADTGLWCYNYRTGKFFLSDQAQEILGRSRGHSMPDWAEFGARLHPDDVEPTRLSMRRHATHGKPYRAEYRYRLGDDDYIWLKVRGRGSWDQDDLIVRTAGTLEDITGEKEAELLRRDITSAMTSDTGLDQKLSTVLAKAAAYLRMSEGVLSHLLDGACEILQSTTSMGPWRKGAVYPLSDVIWSDVPSRDEIQAYPDLANSPLSAHPARTRMAVEAFIGAPIFVKGARFGTLSFLSPSPEVVAAFSDVKLTTVRVVAQWIGEEIGRASHLAELVASDAIKAANLACIGDAVLTVSRAGNIEDANPSATELFGWSVGSLRHMHIEQLLPGAQAMSGPDGALMPVRSRQDVVMRRNGERVTVLLHVSDVQLLDRKLSTVVITDLTLVKQAEAAKRDFVSVVSHELRTPLTSIRGALTMVEAGIAGPLPPMVASLIRVANRNSERLVRLVSDILDIDKLENGKLRLDLKTLALAPAIREAVAANTAYAARFGVTFDVLLPDDSISVVADHDRLSQVMANLLSNAAKFTKAGTAVAIYVTTDKSWVRVSVRDQGPGISDSLRPRLFEKFAQGDNVNIREREGSGLGLSISRNLMHLMNGDIDYAFEVGEGSTFSLRLPRSRDMASDTTQETEAAPGMLGGLLDALLDDNWDRDGEAS